MPCIKRPVPFGLFWEIVYILQRVTTQGHSLVSQGTSSLVLVPHGLISQRLKMPFTINLPTDLKLTNKRFAFTYPCAIFNLCTPQSQMLEICMLTCPWCPMNDNNNNHE